MLPFNDLPIWSGVKTKPQSLKTAEFRLIETAKGAFIQDTTPEILSRLFDYSDANYQHATMPPGTGEMQLRRALYFIQHIQKMAGNLQNKKILEVGAGSTFLAEYCLEKFGVSSYIIVDPFLHKSSASPKIKIISELFEKVDIKEKVDVVLSIATLEHTFEPIDFLRKATALLIDVNSQVITIVPDVESEFKTGDFNAFQHEHIQYFEKSSLQQIYQESGLSISSLYSEQASIFAAGSKASTIYKQIHQSNLIDKKTLATSYQHSKKYLDNIFRENQHQKLAFYGATNGLNIILYLWKDLPDFDVFDSDPQKFGCLMPAKDVAIQNGANCQPDRHHKVIVTAMRFFEEIKSFLITKQGFKPEQVLPATPLVYSHLHI